MSTQFQEMPQRLFRELQVTARTLKSLTAVLPNDQLGHSTSRMLQRFAKSCENVLMRACGRSDLSFALERGSPEMRVYDAWHATLAFLSAEQLKSSPVGTVPQLAGFLNEYRAVAGKLMGLKLSELAEDYDPAIKNRKIDPGMYSLVNRSLKRLTEALAGELDPFPPGRTLRCSSELKELCESPLRSICPDPFARLEPSRSSREHALQDLHHANNLFMATLEIREGSAAAGYLIYDLNPKYGAAKVYLVSKIAAFNRLTQQA